MLVASVVRLGCSFILAPSRFNQRLTQTLLIRFKFSGSGFDFACVSGGGQSHQPEGRLLCSRNIELLFTDVDLISVLDNDAGHVAS